jgi:dTDP-4-dehydrorhamnose 3,5-epimerase
MTTSIKGLFVAETKPIFDSRGLFARLYCEHELKSCVGTRHIVQINYSRTSLLGAIRGLHYQKPPNAELKLVRCLKGRVWDVAVDLRQDSPTFLCWHAEELTPSNNRMMVIPEGFAHGFQVLEPDSEMLYFHTEFYIAASEAGIRYDDPRLAIKWPYSITEVSPRDLAHPLIEHNFSGLVL